MSSFLERFKGKTTQMGKQGLIGVIQNNNGDGVGTRVVVQTNIQFKPQSISKQRQNQPRYNNNARQISNNVSRQKPQRAQKTSYIKNINQGGGLNRPKPNNDKTQQQNNPFLVMNPFCMDQDQPGQPFNPPIIRKATETTVEKQHSQHSYKQSKNIKKITLRGNSTDNKGWTKLGGLGANIGNQQWQQKQKKIQKMQQYAEQVKMSNQAQAKQRKPFQPRQTKKQKTIRQKVLQYSKNIPKPPPRRVHKQVEIQESPQPQNSYNQMQQYERKHRELKKMLNNQN